MNNCSKETAAMLETEAALSIPCPAKRGHGTRFDCNAKVGMWCGSNSVGPWMHQKRYELAPPKKTVSYVGVTPPRGTCTACGREGVPVRNDGAFYNHISLDERLKFKPSSKKWCIGSRNPVIYNYYYDVTVLQDYAAADIRATQVMYNITYGEKEPEMGTTEYYDARIRRLEEARQDEIRRLEELRDRALMLEIEKERARERFGKNEDYAAKSIIYFEYCYDGSGYAYSFAAIKAGKMGGWYTTNKADTNWYTFEQLVDKYLSKSVEVFYVTELRAL